MNEAPRPAGTAQDIRSPTGLTPGRPLQSLTDTQAVWFGHAACLALGLAYWNFRSSSAVTRAVRDLSPTMRDFEHFLAYGLPVIAGMLALLHGLSFRAVRKERVATRKVALAALSRALWPALFSAAALLIACFVWLYKDLRWFAWAPFQGLALGMMAWQGYLWWRPEKQTMEKRLEAEKAPAATALHWTLGALVGAAALYVGWFGYLVTMRHHAIGTCLHDFGIYDHLMYNTINGRWFEAAMMNGERMNYFLADFNNHFFAEHFIPTYWIVTPFYWLFPSAITVLLAQTVMLAIAAVPVYLIAVRKLRSPVLGLLFALLFLVHPIVQQTNVKDVHVDFLAPFFLLAAFAAYLYGWRITYWVMVVFALGVKEEISVNVALMGVFLFLGEKERRLGAATFALGALWFVLVVGLIMPWYRGGQPVRQLDRYDVVIPPEWLEREEAISKGMIVRAVLTHPLQTLELFLEQPRYRGAMILIAPVAMLALWGRWIWVWILPILLAMVLTHSIHMQEMEHHYGSTLMPAVFIGSIWGAWWLLRRDLDPEEPLPRTRVAGIAITLLFMIAITSYEFGFTPGGKRYDPVDYTVLPHNELAHRYLAEVPADAIVSAQLEIGGQLTQRRFIYCFPDVLDAEYIVLDTRSPFWPLNGEEEYRTLITGLLESEEWGLKLPYEDGYLLFKKGHPPHLNLDALTRLTFEPYRPARYGLH